MKKIRKETIDVDFRTCDNCGKQTFNQIYDEEKKKVAFDLCNKCLIDHLKKTFIPEYER